MEQDIPLSYIRRLDGLYNGWIENYDMSKVLVIESDKLDYVYDLIDRLDVMQQIEDLLGGLTKAYPGVIANDDVSFAIDPGEVHALLGENGAGKSTLVKMIYGLVRPDAGHMELHGEPFQPSEPREARSKGVAMVFQHFSLFEALNVAENIALGMDKTPPNLRDNIREVSRAYGLALDPGRLVGDLSAGERQRVEIVRCLLQNPRLLVMDEPTSVLTPQEVATLFDILRQLKDEGTSYQEVLNATREQLALHYLEHSRVSCAEISFLLGFDDPNSFFRAFHAWTGATPEATRARLQPVAA